MPSAVRLRQHYSAEEQRGRAHRSKDVSRADGFSLARVRERMDAERLRRMGAWTVGWCANYRLIMT
jgi:hypothetical protein